MEGRGNSGEVSDEVSEIRGETEEATKFAYAKGAWKVEHCGNLIRIRLNAAFVNKIAQKLNRCASEVGLLGAYLKTRIC